MTCQPVDLTALNLVGAPTLAPDGNTVVAAVQTVDPDTLTYRSRLWSFAPDRAGVPLTETGTWSDTAPRYAPDGRRVAFLSTRDGRKQGYLLDLDSTEVRPLGPVDGAVVALVWLTEDTVAGVVEHPQQDNTSGAPITVEWLRYKSDGETNFVEPICELWSLGPSREPRLLHRPEGRVSGLTAVGGDLAYVLDVRHADEPSPPVQVRRFSPANGTDELVWTCPSKIGALTATDRSGTLIAVTSGVGGQSAVPPRLWLLAGAGAARPVFPDADLEVERSVIGDCRPQGAPRVIQPVAGTDEILFLAAVDDEVVLYQGDPADQRPSRLTPAGWSVTDVSPGRGGRVAVCLERPTNPVELFLTELTDPKPQQLSELNRDWATGAGLVAPEVVELIEPDLRGLLYRPAGAGAGPLVIRVHGGPHLSFGTSFDLETQVLVAAGYRVLLPNPRGSSGRGAGFRALSVGQWGAGDYDDLMAFADWAVDTGVAGPDELYLAGGSYGGYLINWTLTRTDRFRAAISERSISNLLSKYGTSDNGFTVNKFELGGPDLFDNGALALWERSPLRHAPSITTPLLLLHGENDHRCPIEQAEQLFVALRRLGREVRFVRFPGESHTMSTGGRPDRRIARLDIILDWLAEHRVPAR
ncbi:MAG TPA: S9 family peptidase [Pseudonocardiaceae bacterium]|jgi:dipeptidyl aminopeptidase/acylaminoacyl peptidase|nr:S9 family peptidase [Pseudonocardiaceae bacterium]